MSIVAPPVLESEPVNRGITLFPWRMENSDTAIVIDLCAQMISLPV
jgi:hypothetical protein